MDRNKRWWQKEKNKTTGPVWEELRNRITSMAISSPVGHHGTVHNRGKKKQMTAGGSGWSLTPTFDCYEQWDLIQSTSAHVTLFQFNILTRSLRQNICISSPAKITNVESFLFHYKSFNFTHLIHFVSALAPFLLPSAMFEALFIFSQF